MQSKLSKFLLVFVVALVAVAVMAFATSSPAFSSIDAVDSYILDELDASGSANFFVKMNTDANLTPAYEVNDRIDRATFVYDTMTAHADTSQADLLSYLDKEGVSYVSFWINNSVYVLDGNMKLVESLADRSDVAYLYGDREVELQLPVAVEPTTEASVLEWGVERVNADDVWATGNTGQGIVVANIDTGVRWTHNALVNQYRGSAGNHDYHWWDPDGVFAVPTDGNDHGTHTMGTMVGDDGAGNQIGVAPGATWIAAQGCDTNSCSSFDLTSSAQWIACPTDVNGNNPDCSMVPHIVNNSWGGGGGDNWYQGFVDSWHAAGIMPVFSAGNSGPSCNTGGSPGDYRNTVGVGATNINDQLAWFSSKGPGVFTNKVPNLSAPGENVRSATRASDSSYANFSGTSMAAPHVAGAMALMMADTPSATLKNVFRAATATTNTSLLGPPASGATNCGGRDWNVFPNAIYGTGLLDACAAVDHPQLPGGAACP